jgi:hypothetical protein
MISNHTSSVERNQPESARIAAAMHDFLARDGVIKRAESLIAEPKPARSGRIDPETILKRRRKLPTQAERNALRKLAEAL